MTETTEQVDKTARRKELEEELSQLDSDDGGESEVEAEVEEEVDEAEEAAEEIAEEGSKSEEEVEEAADKAAESIAKDLNLTTAQVEQLSENIANRIFAKWKEEKPDDTTKPTKDRKPDKRPKTTHFTERRISLGRKGKR